jgi:hypothetical protein
MAENPYMEDEGGLAERQPKREIKRGKRKSHRGKRASKRKSR